MPKFICFLRFTNAPRLECSPRDRAFTPVSRRPTHRTPLLLVHGAYIRSHSPHVFLLFSPAPVRVPLFSFIKLRARHAKCNEIATGAILQRRRRGISKIAAPVLRNFSFCTLLLRYVILNSTYNYFIIAEHAISKLIKARLWFGWLK